MKTNIYKSNSKRKLNLKTLVLGLALLPAFLPAQIDLTLGLNYAYDPPSGCDNKIKNLQVDICNNGSASAGSFEVAVYLYDPSSSQHWVVDSQTLPSVSGSACRTISNWNIDMNNYCCLPAPGSNYRIGIWIDTANVISETNENNNTSLLSGNISICAAQGVNELKSNVTSLNLFPNPAQAAGMISFGLKQEEQVSVALQDVTGKTAMQIFKGTLPAGSHALQLETASLEAGIYILQMNTSSGTISRKLIVQDK